MSVLKYAIWEQDIFSKEWTKLEEFGSSAEAYRRRDAMDWHRRALRVFPSTVNPNERMYA